MQPANELLCPTERHRGMQPAAGENLKSVHRHFPILKTINDNMASLHSEATDSQRALLKR
jgi:hypothetical protein